MAAIPVPGVNTPTYQSWASQVANRLNYPPMARVTQTAGITVVTAATTKMTFGIVDYDRLGMFDSVQQGFRIPAGEGGIYRLTMSAVFTGATNASHRWLRIFKNGSAFTGHDVTGVPPSSGEGISLNWSDDLVGNQNDLFTMHVYQKSGGDMSIRGAFSIRKVAEPQT